MELKRLLVLANSLKKTGRCVAGREVLSRRPTEFGEWCRPVSWDRPEGELLQRHMIIKGDRSLQPLDMVKIPFSAYAADAVHPEDWVVAEDEPWEIAGTLGRDALPELVETPPSLWLQAGKNSDRVSTAFIKASSQHQSIYLVRPKNLRLRLSKEFDTYKGYDQKKVRTVFDYRGITYTLNLTDPVASGLYCKTFPDVDEPAQEITLPFGDNCVLCVSLTPALNGIHYKVVATILETK
jgi:hypothetical protein